MFVPDLIRKKGTDIAEAYLVLQEHLKEKSYREYRKKEIKILRKRLVLESNIKQQKTQVKRKYKKLAEDTSKEGGEI